MNLIGNKITHKAFGEGIVISQDEGYVTIEFKIGIKKFIYPTAFQDFLKPADVIIAQAIKDELERIQAETLRKRQDEESHADLTRKQNQSNKEKNQAYPRCNIAFKCNYCDGGQSKHQVGFEGVCSDALIHNNIRIEKRTWCSSDESYCRLYLNGEISRYELDSKCQDGGFVCYESQMLREWKAMAGIVQNGDKKGTPMRLNKVQQNSLCILTTREPVMNEADRFIFAVFLVDETYEGDNREEGYVTTSSRFRIKLSPTESKSLLFWNYHANDNQPQIAAWNSGLHRYCDDIQAAQILRDITIIKNKTKDASLAQEFLEYFCTTNNVDIHALPEPTGALKVKVKEK